MKICRDTLDCSTENIFDYYPKLATLYVKHDLESPVIDLWYSHRLYYYS